jgi:hypothetical protein
MKIAGIEMPHVKEDLLSKVEFECALAVQDYDTRMMKFGISIPQNLLITMHEIMCTAAEKTIMGNYDEGNYKTGKDKGDETEEPSC